uniref:Uncharacterized protein n=1 Tax=Anguilla anguilla TaxID=7936 RepID=A0A0E9SR73_ANGAN
MLKLRTLIIGLKLREVVTVLWVVSNRGRLISSPVSASLLQDLSNFPPTLLTSFHMTRNMVLKWNEKKSSQGLYTNNKICTWPLSSLYVKIKKKIKKRRA